MPGTILLGIDVESANENSKGYAQYATEMYHKLDVPVTYYLIGRVLEMWPEVWKELEKDPLIDLQCHTYGHLLLKTVFMDLPPGVQGHDGKPQYLVRGGTLEQIEEDLSKCNRLFQDILGRQPQGLTGPWGYYRGMQDRPDILEILHRHGFRYVRTFARDEKDCQPVPMDWSPFFYGPQGFPDVLELFVHDYQDDFYWKMFARPKEGEVYQDHLKKMAKRVADEDLVWSAASHDHGGATRDGFEHKGQWLRDFISYAKDIGIRFAHGGQYYRETLAKREASGAK